jgi:trimethyllysine dioxygenase
MTGTSSQPSEQPISSSQSSNKPSDLPATTFNDKHVSIQWKNGATSQYHHIWLRDHCRCSKCFHPVTKQRLVNTFEIVPEIKPKMVESTPEGLRITWPSEHWHTSVYPWEWLVQTSYDPPLDPGLLPGSPSTSKNEQEKILWSSRIKDSPPTVKYDEVMQDDKAMLKWLQNIDQFGFCFIEGVPPSTEETEKLTRRIGPIRQTKYGGFWDFTADLAHGDTAYTNLALSAHTDTTYFTDPCGLQLFHLLEQGQGGQTLLVDGFYAASILRQLHPEHFETLSRIRVSTHAAGDDTMYKPSPSIGYPILTLAEEKPGAPPGREVEVKQVRYNNDDRSVLQLAPGEVESWYAALRAWNKCLTSPDSEYWVQLSPGTAVVVDNHRVLHGRASFTGRRRMCGAYIGMDDFRAKLWSLNEHARAGWPEGQVERNKWDPAF